MTDGTDPGDARTTRAARLHAALSRVTSSGRYVPVVDGLRFVSILAVLLYHVGVWPQVVHHDGLGPVEWVVAHVAASGFFGVQLFFAISGMILSQPFAEAALAGRRAPSIGAYYVRRVARIEPPFVICVTVMFALQWALRVAAGRSDFVSVDHYLATLTYTHGALYDEVSTINPVTWSLEVEVQFYLVAPFVFIGLWKLDAAIRRAAIAALVAASLAWIAARPQISHDENATLFVQAPYFLAGVLVADLESSRGAVPTDAVRRVLWDVAAVAAAVVAFLSLLPHSPLSSPVWAGVMLRATCVAVAYLGVFRGRFLRSLLELRWIAVIGGMCYTLYLWHYPVMRLVQARLSQASHGSFLADFAIQAAVLVPMMIVLGAVLFVAFEKPFMHRDWPRRLRDRLARRGRTA